MSSATSCVFISFYQPKVNLRF
ncbi:MAG: hypothetical protein ACTSPG_03150 [Candidatus Hodarchaeales archaeon]